MSDLSEDAELSDLKRAAVVMCEVRLAQSDTGRKFIGRNYLPLKQQQAITNAASNSALVAAVKESAHVDMTFNRMAERFEEMARRQGMTIDAELRPTVVKLLAAELWVNQQALDVPAERLISATLHQGAVAPELLREFPELPRYAVLRAMMHAPAASRDFLQRADKQIESLELESEFQGLVGNRPGEFIHAAVHHLRKARTALRKIAMETGHWAQQEAEREAGDNSTSPETRM